MRQLATNFSQVGALLGLAFWQLVAFYSFGSFLDSAFSLSLLAKPMPRQLLSRFGIIWQQT